MSSILVREVEFADVEAVGQLADTVGWERPTAADWNRLWVDNPALGRHPERFRRGWVLVSGDKLVGYLQNVVQQFSFRDRVYLAASAGSLVVLPEFRGGTMQLVAAFIKQPGIDLLLNTTATCTSASIFQFFKFQQVPQPEYDVSFYWVCRGTGFLQAALRKKNVPAWIARLAGIAGGTAVGFGLRAIGRRPRRPDSKLRTVVLSPAKVGVEFDDLWKRQAASEPRVWAVRDAEAVRWHYLRQPEQPRTFLVSAYDDPRGSDDGGDRQAGNSSHGPSRGSRLVGFVAVAQHDAPHLRLRRARVADLFVEGHDPATIDLLLHAAYQEATRRGTHMLGVVGFPEQIRQRVKLGRPHSLRNGAWLYWYKSNHPDLTDALRDPAAWYACLFDGDGCL